MKYQSKKNDKVETTESKEPTILRKALNAVETTFKRLFTTPPLTPIPSPPSPTPVTQDKKKTSTGNEKKSSTQDQKKSLTGNEKKSSTGNEKKSSTRDTSSTRDKKTSLIPSQKTGRSKKPASTPSKKKYCEITAWFQTYMDEDDDEEAMYDSGIEKLCTQLQVDPCDILLLILAWKMKAETMCCFTKSEWKVGCQAMGVRNLEMLKAKIPALRLEIEGDAGLKELYQFSYTFSKEEGQKR